MSPKKTRKPSEVKSCIKKARKSWQIDAKRLRSPQLWNWNMYVFWYLILIFSSEKWFFLKYHYSTQRNGGNICTQFKSKKVILFSQTWKLTNSRHAYKHYLVFEWVIRSELSLQKCCENLANDGHLQYCEWPSLARITQPFYSVNWLDVKSNLKF